MLYHNEKNVHLRGKVCLRVLAYDSTFRLPVKDTDKL